MPELFFELDRRQFFTAPQFTRMRHRYRGPRESEKINLEINQLSYSFHHLYVSINKTLSKIGTSGFKLVAGDLFEEDDYFISGEEFESSESSPIEYEGLLPLVARVENLKKRVNTLETR